MDIADIRPNPIHQTGIPCNFQNFNLVQGNLLPIYISPCFCSLYIISWLLTHSWKTELGIIEEQWPRQIGLRKQTKIACNQCFLCQAQATGTEMPIL